MPDIKKGLSRLPSKGKIFGVCAGFADYFDIDVSLVRVLAVVLIFFTGGTIVLIYLILAIVLPVPGKSGDTINEKIEILGQDFQGNQVINRTRNYVGIGLIILGAWLLLCQFFPQLFIFRWEFIWPFVIIIIGLVIILRRGDEK